MSWNDGSGSGDNPPSGGIGSGLVGLVVVGGLVLVGTCVSQFSGSTHSFKRDGRTQGWEVNSSILHPSTQHQTYFVDCKYCSKRFEYEKNQWNLANGQLVNHEDECKNNPERKEMREIKRQLEDMDKQKPKSPWAYRDCQYCRTRFYTEPGHSEEARIQFLTHEGGCERNPRVIQYNKEQELKNNN